MHVTVAAVAHDSVRVVHEHVHRAPEISVAPGARAVAPIQAHRDVRQRDAVPLVARKQPLLNNRRREEKGVDVLICFIEHENHREQVGSHPRHGAGTAHVVEVMASHRRDASARHPLVSITDGCRQADVDPVGVDQQTLTERVGQHAAAANVGGLVPERDAQEVGAVTDRGLPEAKVDQVLRQVAVGRHAGASNLAAGSEEQRQRVFRARAAGVERVWDAEDIIELRETSEAGGRGEK